MIINSVNEKQQNIVKNGATRSHSRDLDVVVYWYDQIVESYRMVPAGIKKLGTGADINVPESAFVGVWGLIHCDQQISIHTNSSMKIEVLRDGDIVSLLPGEYQLKDADTYFVSLNNGLRVQIRFAPDSPPVIFASPLLLNISEFLVVFAAALTSLLVAWIIAVKTPQVAATQEEILDRQAEVVFTKLIRQVEADRPVVAPPSDKKSVPKVSDTNTNAKDVSVAEPKVRDVSKTGLLAAFGADTRSNLQQVTEGSKELIGAGGKSGSVPATTFGSGGVSEGIDSKLKDTGGGKGTGATYGIAGVGTKGRSSGSGSYGVVGGIGGKESVQISAGGTGESFAGTIDKEAVRRVVRSALSQIKSCYEREYRKDSKLAGKLVISWEIHAQGVAKNASVVKDKSTLSNASVEDCVKNKILGLRFPEPPIGSAAQVTYPFIFIPDK